MMMNHQEYQGNMEEQLSKLGRRIDELGVEAKNTAGEMRQEYNQNLEQLRTQRDIVQKQMDQLKHTSGQAWEDVKKGVDTAWEEVQKSLQTATSRFNQH